MSVTATAFICVEGRLHSEGANVPCKRARIIYSDDSQENINRWINEENAKWNKRQRSMFPRPSQYHTVRQYGDEIVY